MNDPVEYPVREDSEGESDFGDGGDGKDTAEEAKHKCGKEAV